MLHSACIHHPFLRNSHTVHRRTTRVWSGTEKIPCRPLLCIFGKSTNVWIHEQWTHKYRGTDVGSLPPSSEIWNCTRLGAALQQNVVLIWNAKQHWNALSSNIQNTYTSVVLLGIDSVMHPPSLVDHCDSGHALVDPLYSLVTELRSVWRSLNCLSDEK